MLSCGPALLFGLRLWASVCLALYVAFWLELDNGYWAGTSAALVCQPQLGASLRKGWFRMVGTLVGAVAIVVLTACFPQDRLGFLIGLALWGGASAGAATLLRNFASYAAALAGYTVAIIASDQLGASGGVNGEAFMLAVTRVSEICIGIASAGIVLAGTDLGGARGRLATLFASLAAGITAGLTRTLAFAGPGLGDTRPVRRDFIRRIIALDPVIDGTIGESPQIRPHTPVLQRAVDGFFTALSGWRAVANHLVRLPPGQAGEAVMPILQRLPPDMPTGQADPARWTDDPCGVQRACKAAAKDMRALPAGTPSLRLLADKSAEALAGISDALAGLAVLVADPARPVVRRRGNARLRVPDWLPALVNSGRAFVTISVVALFWVVTAWPSGAGAITWATITVILMSPRADQAYGASVRFAIGNGLAAIFAAIWLFAILPHTQTFAGFSLALGAYLVPFGALAAQPWETALFAPMAGNFVPLLGPENQMSYDPGAFYNSAMAIVGGSAAAASAFRLLPPLSPAFRTRRLLMLTIRDLRRLARGWVPTDWAGHIHGRLSVIPEQATPLQRARLLAALSVGTEIIQLRGIARSLALSARLDPALTAIAQGNSAIAIAHLAQVDAELAARAVTGARTQTILRVRGSLLVISEVLTEHAAYFDWGASP